MRMSRLKIKIHKQSEEEKKKKKSRYRNVPSKGGAFGKGPQVGGAQPGGGLTPPPGPPVGGKK